MITIVGAGPAGNYAAYLLANAGNAVQVYEEHPAIGQPVQCTGILSDTISEILPVPKSVIVNTTTRARILGTRGHVDIKLSNPNIILDRAKFDRWLADKAEKAGARYSLSSRFMGREGERILITRGGKTVRSSTDILIGADGPLSAVARTSGLARKRVFFTGLQATVRLQNDNIVEFYPYPYGFGWVVPENRDTVRIGVAVYGNPHRQFGHLLRERVGKGFEKMLTGKQAGLIPIYNPKQATQKGSTYLLGDAAGHVKATTGGGIIQGLIGARCLAQALATGQSYDLLWRQAMGKQLRAHLFARRIMDRFSEHDYDHIVSTFARDRMQTILGQTSRDKPIALMAKLLAAEPRLIRYATRLLRRPHSHAKNI